MEGTQRTGTEWGRIADWLMGFYTWVVALTFGAALIDSAYARSLSGSTSVAAVARAFNEAADIQQLPMTLGVVVGIGALVIVAQQPLARYLVIASLGLSLAPLPVVLLLGDLADKAGAGTGTGLRLALSAGASLFAMAATIVFLGRARGGGGMPSPPVAS